MAEDARKRLAVWRIVVLVGLVGNMAGILSDVPILTLIFAPVTIVGAIGLLITNNKVKQAGRRR
ncbi:hypothetical protein ACFPIJ_30040 [Dactylosporangium cerinum]|uniref:Uncharacterized protein n=1 Tax=Dactylosporangium cerinum TaxID=1434730 RepID=A0ABV9W109_9ACTN